MKETNKYILELREPSQKGHKYPSLKDTDKTCVPYCAMKRDEISAYSKYLKCMGYKE